LFALLGVQPVLGRPFNAADEKLRSEQPVILSYGAWQRHFGGESRVLDRRIILDGRSSVIVGVMPNGFEFPNGDTEFWTPLDLTPPLPASGEIRFATPLARLKDGVDVQMAAAEVTTIVEHVRQTYPPDRADPPASFQVLSIKDEMVRPVRAA